MSVEAMTLVLHHSKASGTAQMVLMGIANHMGDGGAFPSIATLAKYGKVSERRVQQIIRELEVSGELEVRNGMGKSVSTGFTNLYFVTIECPENCDGTMNHKTQNEEFSRGEISDTRGEASFIPRGEILSQGVKSGAVRGEISDTRGEISMSEGVKPVSPKPVINPTINQTKEPFAKSRTLPKDFSLTEEMISWSKKQNAGFDSQLEFQKFTNWHTAKGSTMKNWDAAWRTWVLNSLKFSKPEATDPWAHLGGNK